MLEEQFSYFRRIDQDDKAHLASHTFQSNCSFVGLEDTKCEKQITAQLTGQLASGKKIETKVGYGLHIVQCNRMRNKVRQLLVIGVLPQLDK